MIRSVIRNRSPRLLTGDHTLYQSGDDCEDCASGAAADDLTDDGPEIEVAAGRRACDRRNEGLQNLTSADTPDGTGDGVAEIAQIVVLQRSAGGVPADDSRDELNDQIDDRFHGASLSLQRDAAVPGCRYRHTLPRCARSYERQTKRLRVVGLIGRTRGSNASLHEAQRSRSRTRMHGLARLTHNVDCSAQRVRHVKCITTP